VLLLLLSCVVGADGVVVDDISVYDVVVGSVAVCGVEVAVGIVLGYDDVVVEYGV